MHFVIMKTKYYMHILRTIIVGLLVILMFGGGVFYFTDLPQASGNPVTSVMEGIALFTQSRIETAPRPKIDSTSLQKPVFVSQGDAANPQSLKINVATLFRAPVTFEEPITAPNLTYLVAGGDGIELIGDQQSPTIRNTGVLSLEGMSGDVLLESDTIQISASDGKIRLSADFSPVTEAEVEAWIFDENNTGTLRSGTLALDRLAYTGALPQSTLIGNYAGITGVGTLGSLLVSGTVSGGSLLQNGYEVCDVSGNCAGSGSPITGTGTAGFITRWSSSDTIESSSLFDNGRVGIGTTDPRVALEIDGEVLGMNGFYVGAYTSANLLSSASTGSTSSSLYIGSDLILTAGNISGIPDINYWDRTGTTLSPVTAGDVLVIQSDNTPLALVNTGSTPTFIAHDETNDTSPFLIDAGGNVGVGTTSPAMKLDVHGRIGIGGTQILSLPSQSTFYGTLIVGNGGQQLSSSGGNQGQYNTFVGIVAGSANTSGYFNTFLGSGAGLNNTTGYHNTFVGQLAGFSNVSGLANTYVGRAAGAFAAGAGNNTFLGDAAGFQNTSGGSNTLIGSQANYNNQTGSNNVIIGYQAGYGTALHNKTGSVLIGYRAGYFEQSNNKLYIDNSDTSSPLIWGDFGSDTLGVNGALGVGTISPQHRLHVAGAALATDGFFVGVGLSSNFISPTISGTTSATLFIGNRAILTSANIGVPLGVQSYSLPLTSIANLTTSSDEMVYTISSGSYATTSLTAFARTLLDDGDALTMRGTLELGTMATQDADSVAITGGTINNITSLGVGTSVNAGAVVTIDNLPSGTGTAVVIDSSGNVWRDSSSIRYKTDIQPLEADFSKILTQKPVSYRFAGTAMSTIGYIAEDLHDAGLTDLVVYDTNGRPDGIKYDRLGIYALELVKRQGEEITSLRDQMMLLDSEGTVEFTPDATTGATEVPSAVLAPEIEISPTYEALSSSIHASMRTLTGEVDEKIATLSSDIVRIKSDVAQEQERNDILGMQTASLSAELRRLNDEIGSIRQDILTASAAASLDAARSVLSELVVTGNTNLYDVGIVGTLTAGLMRFDGLSGAVNTLSEPLRLQSEKMADVEIMGGMVRIGTDGSVAVRGEVASDKYRITIRDDGSASAGEGIVPAGADSVVVPTSSVTATSLIYVTFTSDYSPATRFWVSERTEGASFALKLDQPLDADGVFSWWIVN